MAAAFQLATTLTPASQPEPLGGRPRDLRGQRLGAGQPQPHAIADSRDGEHLGGEPVLRRAVRRLADRLDGDLPGIDAHRHAALARVGAGDRTAAVQLHAREAVRARAGDAREHDRPREVGDERRTRRRRELGRGALLDDVAGVDHADAVAQLRCLSEVMGHEQRRHLEVAQHPRELPCGSGTRARIERRERLVQ